MSTSRRYAQSHEWIQVEGNIGTVGISDHAQKEVTDVVYVEMSDADPAVVSLAWPRGSLRPIVGAFIEVTRQLARASAEIP